MTERVHIPASPACGQWETLLADASTSTPTSSLSTSNVSFRLRLHFREPHIFPQLRQRTPSQGLASVPRRRSRRIFTTAFSPLMEKCTDLLTAIFLRGKLLKSPVYRILARLARNCSGRFPILSPRAAIFLRFTQWANPSSRPPWDLSLSQANGGFRRWWSAMSTVPRAKFGSE